MTIELHPGDSEYDNERYLGDIIDEIEWLESLLDRYKYRLIQEDLSTILSRCGDDVPAISAHPISAYPIFDHVSVMARCSNCKRYTIGYDMDGWDNYCSCCGAKMDGKRKDGDSDEVD